MQIKGRIEYKQLSDKRDVDVVDVLKGLTPGVAGSPCVAGTLGACSRCCRGAPGVAGASGRYPGVSGAPGTARALGACSRRCRGAPDVAGASGRSQSVAGLQAGFQVYQGLQTHIVGVLLEQQG